LATVPTDPAKPSVRDPITEIFPPDDPAARFTVAMAMAMNDVERSVRDSVRAVDEDRPDFTYRLRLTAGHFAEALVALDAYSAGSAEARKLMGRVPPEGQAQLKVVRGTTKAVGAEVLQAVRDNTFHYPSPRTNYAPTSDEKLRFVLAAMGHDEADIHLDGDTKAMTMTFADGVALNMAMGMPDADDVEVHKHFERIRDGAIAFCVWTKALVHTYVTTNGFEFGEPSVTPKTSPPSAPR
jgi:hypothetical protein